MPSCHCCTQHGVEGVELALTKVWPEPLEAPAPRFALTATRWEKQGLRIVALQALLFGKPHLTAVRLGRRARRQTLDYLSGIIERAGMAGCARPGVRVAEESSARRTKLERGVGHRRAVFPRVGHASRGGMVCASASSRIRRQYGCDFVTTVAEGIELVDAVGEEGFGLHLDTAAWC